MNILRKTGLVIAATLLPIFLFSFGFTFSFYQVYSSPGHIKSALEESGVYDTVISDLLENAKTDEGQQQNSKIDIPVDRPEVKQIIGQAASPAFLQSQTEGFLDGLYAWVRGDSEQLNLEINLTQAKAKLADGLAQYAANRAATLPTCTATDLSLIQPGNFDVMDAQCLPPGTDVNAAVEKIRQEINGDEFLKDPVITEKDLKNDQGQSLEEQLKEVPGIFDRLVKALWISGTIVVLLSAAVIGLSKPWRNGLKRVGITLISVGGTVTVLALLASFVATAIAEAVAKEGAVQKSLGEILKILVGDFRNWWLGFGLVVLFLGIAMLISLKFIKTDKEPIETGEPLPEKLEKPAKPSRTSEEPKNSHITKTV